MLNHAREMKVVRILRPYPDSPGIQYDVSHPRGIIHAVYQETPVIVSYLRARLRDGRGILSYFDKNWTVYLFLNEDGSQAFDRPDKALAGALHVAQEHMRQHPEWRPIDLERPLTLETAAAVLETTYPPSAALAAGAGRTR